MKDGLRSRLICVHLCSSVVDSLRPCPDEEPRELTEPPRMPEPTPVVPVLSYGVPDPPMAGRTWTVVLLAAAGFVVAIAAARFNGFTLLIMVDEHDGGRHHYTAPAAAFSAAAVVDLLLSASLFLRSVQLLRRRPSSVRLLRRWCYGCLVGVGCYVVASTGCIWAHASWLGRRWDDPGAYLNTVQLGNYVTK
jgi:hypothetical protein